MRFLTNLTQHLAFQKSFSFATMASGNHLSSQLSDSPSSSSGADSGSGGSAVGRNDQDQLSGLIHPRLNVFGSVLQPVPSSASPATGFFRNNYCDSSPLDPGSHTVAALITPSFLKFSASNGNDLTSLFPKKKDGQVVEGCYWCLCASRWWEALQGSKDHPEGEAIVPKVKLEATHSRWALGVRGGASDDFKKSELERFALGGDGQGV